MTTTTGSRQPSKGPRRSAPCRVLLVDDHVSFVQALGTVLELDGFVVAAKTADGDEAAELAATHDVDIALVDLDLPGIDGAEAIARIRRSSPRTACLVLTGLTDPATLGRALEAGAAGVLHKSIDMSDLVDAVKRAARGLWLVSPDQASDWLGALRGTREQDWWRMMVERSLTPREREVLALLAEGGTNQSMADDLGISPETVQTHIRNILPKVGARSRLEAVTSAIRVGIVDPPS